ncbi:hypothetical protein L0244_18440 [bacterium]|nr:hypothetical protein [bacterium]
MPPQVTRAGSAGGSAVQHSHPAEVQKEDSKATSSIESNAGTTQSTDNKSSAAKHENSRTAAKVTEGSKQNAMDHNRQHNEQAKMMKKNLEKRLPNSDSGSMYESVKNAAELVAVKLPAAAKATAQAAAEAGANSIRKQEIQQLSQRAHPQDMVKGQKFEVEDIKPSSTNKVETRKNTEYLTGAAQGKFFKPTNHPKGYREATQSGLQDRLTELNGGASPTEFEKELVSQWGKSTIEKWKDDRDGRIKLMSKARISTLTPIKGPGNEVEAYKVQRGIIETYYDRNGNVLKDSRPIPEKPLEEGIAPWEVISLAQAGKHLLTKGAMAFGEKVLAKEAATTITKAEAGTIVRTAEKQVVKAETEGTIRSAEKRVASETEKAGVSTHNTSWRQGSGTSVHAKPNASTAKATASEFTEAEKKAINELQDAGMLRKEAEDVIRSTRGAENTVEVIKSGPNAGGSIRSSKR